MARPLKKSVYERIESVKLEIAAKEQEIAELNKVLDDLYLEKDQLEMQQMLSMIREKNIDIREALSRLSGDNVGNNVEETSPNTSVKKNNLVKTKDKNQEDNSTNNSAEDINNIE